MTSFLPSERHNDRLSAPIVLKLGSDWAKQDLLSKYFKLKNLNTSDLGYQSKARIYINESLTTHNRAIFKAASEAKKAKLITKCYTRNGIVHIQITNEGKTFRIHDADQLNAIISPRSNPIVQATSNPRFTGQSPNPNPTSSQLSSSQTTTDPIEVLKADEPTKPDNEAVMHDGDRMEGQ